MCVSVCVHACVYVRVCAWCCLCVCVGGGGGGGVMFEVYVCQGVWGGGGGCREAGRGRLISACRLAPIFKAGHQKTVLCVFILRNDRDNLGSRDREPWDCLFFPFVS